MFRPTSYTYTPEHWRPLGMEKITEDLIERYVGFPDTLDREFQIAIEAGIKSDPSLRRVADFYRAYYSELRGDEHRPHDESGPVD